MKISDLEPNIAKEQTLIIGLLITQLIIEEVALYTDDVIHSKYDAILDRIHGIVQVADSHYTTSAILKTVDPVAYRVGFDAWLRAGEWEQIGDYYAASEDVESAKRYYGMGWQNNT